MKLEELQKQFECPDAKQRAMPFWAWNGDLKEEELLRQIDIMKEMGFGGFFMHSRTGLETEYLGEEWFRLINRCAEYGKERGLMPWLYDEDRWPSGSAGGMVTQEEKYRSWYMVMHTVTAGEYIGRADETCAGGEIKLLTYACRLEGTAYTDGRELAEGELPSDGETVLIFTAKHPECSDNYNGYTYLDTMNREAVESYIRTTHEAYRKHCGEKFGASIYGIFTDEPHRGALFTFFSDGKENAAPYTPGLFDEFRKRFGYDLKCRLPELFLRKDKRALSKTAWDYIELCQELFLENFAKPLYDWCSENHLEFTGHVLHEDCLCSQTVMQGSLMRFYEYMHRPGVDVLGSGNRCYWIVKQIESVARQQEKKWVLSELNGCTGWQTSLNTYKNIGDWQRLFGVNFRCPHLSWYTMKGEAKRDYPASILHQSAWYREYEALETYFARIGVLMDEGEPECELLVVSPIESVWARAYSGAFYGLSARDPEIQRLEEQYAKVFHSLAGCRIDFDYGDEDHIARFGRVEKGCLYIGKQAYKKVLVAGCDTVRNTTLSLLCEFDGQGGSVVFAGRVPEYVDAAPSDKAVKFAESGRPCRIALEPGAIAAACRSGREIEVTGEGSREIFVQTRRLDGAHRSVMLLNTDRDRPRPGLTIDLGQCTAVTRWDPMTGERRAEHAVTAGGRCLLKTSFASGESRLYVLRTGCSSEPEPGTGTENWQSPAAEKRERLNTVCPEKWKYRLEEPNVCVLDRARVELSDGTVIPEQEILKADRALREHFNIPARGGEMLQPWYARKYRSGTDKPVCTAVQRFCFTVETVPEDDIELVLEDLEHTGSVRVNGEELLRESHGKWIDICFDRLTVSRKLLKYGENQVEITVSYHSTSGLEAVYLLGSFGVTAERESERMYPVLTALPESIRLGDITEQGLLFYSGKLVYLMDIPADWAGRRVAAAVPGFAGSCVGLRCGSAEKLICFPPYEAEITELIANGGKLEIETVLTRRNTFGPLHMLPALVDGYGPASFVTEGSTWSVAFVTLPQGLLTAPEFYCII